MLEGENRLPCVDARLLIVVLYQVQKHFEQLSLILLRKVSDLVCAHPRHNLMEAGSDLGPDIRRAILAVWLQELNRLPINGVVNNR